jgi:hypothetical protein
MSRKTIKVTVPQFTFEADTFLGKSGEDYHVEFYDNNIPDVLLETVYSAVLKAVKKEFKIKKIYKNEKMKGGYTYNRCGTTSCYFPTSLYYGDEYKTDGVEK